MRPFTISSLQYSYLVGALNCYEPDPPDSPSQIFAYVPWTGPEMMGLALLRPPSLTPPHVPLWVCAVCDGCWRSELDAETCCESDLHVNLVCPVCLRTDYSIKACVECCLWRDFDVGQRDAIAAAVAGGQVWLEAIAEAGAGHPEPVLAWPPRYSAPSAWCAP